MFCFVLYDINIYLEVLDAITFTESDLEDVHRGHVGQPDESSSASHCPRPRPVSRDPSGTPGMRLMRQLVNNTINVIPLHTCCSANI